MHKLVATIMVTIGQAKAADEEKRELPPVQRPQPLLPPRPADRVVVRTGYKGNELDRIDR